MTNRRYNFSVGNEVRFTDEARRLFDNDAEHGGIFTVAEVASVPRTCVDPFSPDHMEGQNAVGHNQSLRLEGREGWVSAALLEPTREWSEADQADFDSGVAELFDGLFAKAEAGEITYEQIERFFPREVIERSHV